MKFIWILKPLWQLPFHFSNLLSCFLPLFPVFHEIFAWKQNRGFHFSLFQPNELHQTKSSGISQWICPFCPAIHHSPASTADTVAVENIIRGKGDLRKGIFPISSAWCQLIPATVAQFNEPRQAPQSGNAAKSQFLISSSCSLNKLHICECSTRKREDKRGQTNTSLYFHRNLEDNHPAPAHRVKNPRGAPWVSCGSMVIPGCCSKVTAGRKACGNCSCHLSHLFSNSQPEWEFTNQQELEKSYFSQKMS